MTALDMTTCTTMLGLYIDAEKKILEGQTVKMGDRWLARANLAEVQAGVKMWQQRYDLAVQGDAGLKRSINVAPWF